MDLFGDDPAAYSKNTVRSGVPIRTDHAVETIIDEFDRTVIFDGDSDAARRLNQISEGSSSRKVAGATAVVRAMYSFDETEPGDVDVFPTKRIVEGHGIGVAGIEPANRARADAGKDRTAAICGF